MELRSIQGSINEYEFMLFKNYIAKISGIIIQPEKAYLIETRLSKLMLDCGAASFEEFYEYIISETDPAMPQKIIDVITINETMWFRDTMPWNVMERVALPALIDDLISGKKSKIRIWCSAVSTGQEVYSAVMCIDDYLNKNNIKGVDLSNFDFVATDISNRVLETAKNGRYDRISIMRGLNDYYRTKYFENSGTAWEISPKIKNAVKFSRFNLQDSFFAFGTFDIIFCRYVLIYFSDEFKKEIASKMYSSLADGGLLFTGNYVLYDLFKDDFDTKPYSNSTYYTKKKVII
ncbi:MAG: protein-glutamate O-methyltransferase CheR [Treponema sp.]|nr:protein-glutamate O-methyltransferase CheR [Treponema sp.]